MQMDFITTADAARIAKVSEDTIRAWERRGILPATKTPSGLRLFSRADVERLAAERAAKRGTAGEPSKL